MSTNLISLHTLNHLLSCIVRWRILHANSATFVKDHSLGYFPKWEHICAVWYCKHTQDAVFKEPQIRVNLRGEACDGGLDKHEFYIDGLRIRRSLGSPRRGMDAAFYISKSELIRDPIVDGPALRATAMMQYAEWPHKTGNSTCVEKVLWPIIRLDFDYMSTNFWFVSP